MSALRLAVVLWCEASSLAVVLTGDIPVWLSVLVLTVIPVVGLAKEDSAWLGPVRAASSIMAILYLLFFPVDWLVLSDRFDFRCGSPVVLPEGTHIASFEDEAGSQSHSMFFASSRCWPPLL